MKGPGSALGARRSAANDGRRESVGGRVVRVIRTIIGAPDYERYVEHRERAHPGEEILSRDEFERERQAARYERPGARCC